ncbi:[SSU ribosomal protein S18P]-alanine acetyltransferase [Alteribacillus persepolensis]|uniref:[SSU ribosomal protein S18P]-alanine acetyltransferase n=1 Tax=Alteribacillus persepolensis TaxID=568899 RepID=A0A1G8J598_9BACI|nr:ribosomal protein S18-alanine N-acetyltransferase [Alteribacillus persepolensis]SDI26419.1 [SSU ribosomal protein S18P]-alanine acetyltransferase [Alteribacillus persepolensis]
MSSPVIRFMEESDIEGVLRVEHDAFQMPWTRYAFVNEIINNQFAHYLVAEQKNEIVGYCGVWVIIDEAHITNIAVHSSYRGQKIGEMLLTNALDMAYAYGAKTMTLEVRVSNAAAQSLYKKLGFQAGGIRKRYYTDNHEDALVMWVNIHEYKQAAKRK